MKDSPLGLPKGSVRAMLAITITISSIIALFMRPEIVDKMIPVLMGVLAFYFGNRSDFGKTGGN